MSAAKPAAPKKTFTQRLLDAVEVAGNKVPHPAIIFLALIGIVVVLSHLLYLMGTSVTYQVVNPDTDQVEEATSTARSLLTAVKLADVLKSANLPPLLLLLGFVVVVLLLDLIITGAIPKWAIFAPIFVPLLMKLNVAPEAVLAAYRVGDSPVNAISPLNAYFAMIVAFAQRYQKDAGVGTVVALMLPYVAIISVLWTILLAVWYLLGLPWGLG